MQDRVTFSWGTTPPEIIRERLEALGRPYPMELVGEDAEVIREVVNQGIDSHLEAIFGTFEWKPRKLESGAVLAVPLCCELEPDSMLVLLRRLEEYDSDDEERQDAAMSLRSSILETLEIEEI